MHKKLVSVLGAFALLSVSFAPAYADDAPPVGDQTASSTPSIELPAGTDVVIPIATSTEPAVEESTTTQATTTDTGSLQDSGATASTTLSINGSLTPPNGCAATDTNGTVHTYPESTSTPYLAICALEQAVSNSIITSYEITNADFGLYLTGINGIGAGPSEYWAVYVNGGYASCGVSCLPLSVGDTLSFVRTDWSTNTEYDRLDLHVVGSSTSSTTPTQNNNGADGGSSGSNATPNVGLNIPDAFAFLSSLQNSDGSWDELVSDWAAFAYAVPGAPGGPKSLLVKYLKDANVRTSNVTDAERHALALMALGINPYTGASTDYITPIVKAYDGTQIGDPSNPRDDIFGMLVLSHAGYSAKDPMLTSMASTIASQQESDGSWQDADTTAAAIQALNMIGAEGGAVARGETYLRNLQQVDGGFYNISSTAWTVQAIVALGEDPSSWSKGGKTPLSYFGALQQADGSLSTSGTAMNRAWEVAYAIPAAKGLSWDDILHNYTKIAVAPNTVAAATSTATTTTPLPVTATSTVPVLPIATTTATTSPVYPVIALAPAEPHRATVAPTVLGTTTSTPDSDLDLTASVGNASTSSGILKAIGTMLHSLMQFFSSLF